jgi:hypothetical protein
MLPFELTARQKLEIRQRKKLTQYLVFLSCVPSANASNLTK